MEEQRIKAFDSVKKHWSQTLHDPSADLKTPVGRFFVYLHRIDSVNHDGFRPSISPFFPYGIKSISSRGGLPGMHLYFSAIMDGKVKDPQKRKHYQMTLYLPGLKELLIGGDTFHYGLEERVFNEFYLPPLKRKKKQPEVKFGDSVYKIFSSHNMGDGGLVVIPDTLSLTRAIEISVKEISQEEWKKGPWAMTDMGTEMTRALQEANEESSRMHRLPPDWRNRVIR